MMRVVRLLPLLTLVGTLAAQDSTGAPAPAPINPPAVSFDDLVHIKPVPYAPAIKRDPFATPTDEETVGKGDTVDDISVKGVLRKDGKLFAVVSDSRGNVNWLPVGHTFRDGVIFSIDEKSVTFHQWELNSTNHSVYRTVIKTFKREEGKR
ncbi:MAG TPA: hypothetical protein VJ600_08690 [Holophagaceae bacterium]|nr:hypothetical protein [Holophagaceae bacterium]